MANEHELFDDELFDQRIHDAYERVELSEEAQSRMLANLLAAQQNAQTQEVPAAFGGESQVTQIMQGSDSPDSKTEMLPTASSAPQPTRPKHAAAGETQVMRPAAEAAMRDDTAAQEQTEAKVLHMSPRKKGWLRWLPIAAVLAVAFVVVQATGLIGNRSEDAATSFAAKETAVMNEDVDAVEAESADEEEAAESSLVNSYGSAEDEELFAMPEESADAGQVVDVSTMTSVDFYPSIKLEDGRWLTALRDGLYVDEVDASLVGEPVGEGKASSFDDPDGSSAISCQVFDLLDDSDDYAVQYEGEDTFWRCTIVE